MNDRVQQPESDASDGGHAVVWSATVTGMGELVPSFFEEGIVVLFPHDAPEELHDMSVLHRITHPLDDDDGVRPGDVVQLGRARLQVLAVGHVANDNLRALGHLVLKRNGKTEPALPGDVCCDTGPIPELSVDEEIVVFRPAEEGAS